VVPVDENAKSTGDGNASPTLTHATPISFGTRSPVYSDSTPITIDTPSDTLISTRSFSFTHTLPGAYIDQNQAKESLGREQADLEVVKPGNYDKEVCFPDYTEKEVPAETRSHLDGEARSEQRETNHGFRKRKFWLIVLAVCFLISGIALGVGLGVGLKKHK
jgi:hypothetical protein